MGRDFFEQFNLTKAQIRVAEQCVLGKSNQAIGDALHIAERTVKFHLCKVFKKVGVRSRCELIVRAAGMPDPLARARTSG